MKQFFFSTFTALALFVTCAVCAGALAPNASAQGVKYDYVSATGEGETRELAILTALKSALMQKGGVNIAALVRMQSELNESSVVNQENGKTTEKAKIVSKDSFKKQLVAACSGRIDGYEEISVTKTEQNTILAVLRVKFIQSANSKLSKLAVLPYRLVKTPGAYRLDGTHLHPSAIAERFTHRQVTGFVQSKRFTVLDRHYIAERMNEKAYQNRPSVAASDLVKYGKELGADFVVAGTIEEFKGRAITAGYTTTYSGTTIVAFQVINVGTGEIIWADTVRLNLDKDVLGTTLETRFDSAITQVGERVSGLTIESIYPIKVAGPPSFDGELQLLRGGKEVKVGQRYLVMNIGSDIVDEDTGEKVKLETKIAEIQIVRVHPKISFAKVLRGNGAQIKRNDVCRPIKTGAE
ncbi:MAG: penicillin-binding protein activator LpoB [Puniceicoccales bacterium]|jgi:curli biogenesis system outer membrane secretion channel CsgG|nr:penicillin-binding protein activator LpoB [Puniceicoccales bacterium]